MIEKLKSLEDLYLSTVIVELASLHLDVKDLTLRKVFVV